MEMTILDTQLQSDLSANSVPLHFEQYMDRYQGIQAAAEVSKRFLRTAALLPVGKYLGLQINLTKEKNYMGAAFSSPNTAVEIEDYIWLFQQCADICPLSASNLQDLYSGNRKVYRLSSDAINVADSASKAHDDCDSDDGLFEMLHKAGAIIRIVANASAAAGFGHASVYISLPEEITLRARSAFSYAFPHTTIEEVGETAYPCGTDCIPDNCFQKVMEKLLCALTIRTVAADASSEEDICEAMPTKVHNDAPFTATVSSSTSIDNLEFTIRTYNSLKRAGINTVNELMQTNDYELRNIRNLGRKGYDEVKNFLHEIQCEKKNVNRQTASHMAMLDELVGLENVKKQLKRITAFAKLKQNMQAKGINSVPIALNMEFVGNPGTAKTTVARIAAGIFHEIGLLANNELIEVGRAGLVAEYEGQTAAKVKEVFSKAKGKMLFIDEAYSLVDCWEGAYGDEAITAIVQEMENNSTDTIVVFAGYPKKMEAFFDRNPGLRSRVPFKITFNDYSAEEMVRIAESEAGKRGFAINDEAHNKMYAILSEAAKYPDLGNGRFCRNLIEDAILNFASRVYGCCNDKPLETDFLLSADDFNTSEFLHEKAGKLPLGFQV